MTVDDVNGRGGFNSAAPGSRIVHYRGEGLWLAPYSRLESSVLEGGGLGLLGADNKRGYTVVRDTLIREASRAVSDQQQHGGPVTLERVVVNGQDESSNLPAGLLWDCEFTGSEGGAVEGPGARNQEFVVKGGRFADNAWWAIRGGTRLVGALIERNGAERRATVEQVMRVHRSTFVGNRGVAIESPNHAPTLVTDSNLVRNAGYAFDGAVSGAGNYIAENNGSDQVDLSEGDRSDSDQWRSPSVTEARRSAAPEAPAFE